MRLLRSFITPVVLGIAEVLRFTLLIDGCACVCDSFPPVCVFASFPSQTPLVGMWVCVCLCLIHSLP